jgi:MFS transporter, SP family, general alpha glucoside:H+ symporter
MLVHTIKIENEVTAGATYWDCFNGVYLRRTEIRCVTFAG